MEAEAAMMPRRAWRSWRRAAVAVVLGVVALAVVGMHQLSFGHLFVTPAAGHAQASSHVHAVNSGAAGTQRAVTLPAHDAMAAQMSPSAGHHLASAPSLETRPTADAGCTDCGGHVMGLGTCLLALTSLVLFWWLRLPRPRQLPPPLRRWRSLVAPALARPSRIHALSLTELSILRT